MAPPRTFDYDTLKGLIRSCPEWSYARYADVLTAEARETDPHAPRIKPDAIRRVVSQYRDEWIEQGLRIPSRGLVYGELLPPLTAVATNNWMATPLRYLREIAKDRRGEAPVTDNEAIIRGQALRWEGRLRENRQIADLTSDGQVIIRPAKEDELDEDGQILEIAAWVLPGRELVTRRSRRGRG
jgi:hypothetical protein